MGSGEGGAGHVGEPSPPTFSTVTPGQESIPHALTPIIMNQHKESKRLKMQETNPEAVEIGGI